MAEITIISLCDAFNTLKIAYDDYAKYKEAKNPLFVYLEDAVIHRYEYTLETALKLMRKIIMKDFSMKNEPLSKNTILERMQNNGFITDFIKWRDYYTFRNNTAHEYSYKKSRDFAILVPDFIKELDYMINKLKDFGYDVT